jgi:hypothetical protein
VLTRLVTTVRPSERCTLVASNRDLVYPGVVARGVDRSACGSNGSGAAGSGGTAGDAQQGSGGAWAYGCACYCGDLECYRASQNVCAWHNCWHSPPPSDPSRERADESGCSSETVVVYADDGCASDTSSSYEDDGCASDTSSSYEDDGCASDTSSSYEDDGCSGDTVDDSDSACSFAKRPRMSTCTYGFALILLAARRWRRKREKWA